MGRNGHRMDSSGGRRELCPSEVFLGEKTWGWASLWLLGCPWQGHSGTQPWVQNVFTVSTVHPELLQARCALGTPDTFLCWV